MSLRAPLARALNHGSAHEGVHHWVVQRFTALALAPLLLGGSAARDPLEGKGVERISEALRALTFECTNVGEDLLVSARLREW